MGRPLPDLVRRLVPRPRRIEHGDGVLSLARGAAVVCAHVPERDRPALERAARRVRDGLAALGIEPLAEDRSGVPAVRLTIEPGVGPAQGYELALGPTGARLAGHDGAGVFYAACTLLQVARLAADGAPAGALALPGLRVRDAPDFAARGVSLDISRDKVPTLETLYELVELLASWKVNELQLYTEHTFAYAGHEVVWRDASPLTPDEVRALDRFCAERCVELVPNQQSFGHLHRWLVHEPYRRLAEVPEGIEHPFSPRREPYGLCPLDPGSLALLADLYDQLLPCFASGMLNVGLDETVDLGLGRSRAACAERGRARVYLEFLRGVHGLCAARGRRMQFFADMLRGYPDLVRELPRDALPLVWGYEADHSFAAELEPIAAAGLEHYVCPGTSSWQSLGGRIDNAARNLQAAARAGRASGARGYLVTDWGDRGHMQPLPVSWPGFLLGAALGWNAGDDDLDPAARLDAHAFRDEAGVAGGALCALGRAGEAAGSTVRNGSALFFLLERAAEDLPHARTAGVTAASLERAAEHVARALAPLDRARLGRPDAELVRAELAWVGDALDLACRLGRARLAGDPPARTSELPAGRRAALAGALAELIARQREIWLARNRPGGLRDSAARLERVLAELAPAERT